MTYFLIFLSSLFAISLSLFNVSPSQSRQIRPIYFAPPQVISRFSFGFSQVYADILWMRLIQDIDFCSSKKGLPLYDGKHKYQCEKGWSYKMTDAITELDPRFLKAYTMSGTIMSVIMQDKIGAKKIFDKAVTRFPNNWKIHFSAAYHYLLVLKKEERASQLLIRAADLGAPHWLYALAAKTYRKSGRLLLAREVLLTALEADISGKYKKSLELRLKVIEEQLKESKVSF